MAGELYYAVFPTAAGYAGTLASRNGLKCVTLPQPSETDAVNLLDAAGKQATYSPELFGDLIRRLQDYYQGLPVDFPDGLDLSGATEFQRAVWRATQRVPRGQTRSYGWVAGKVGKPRAARAVGQALGSNPLPVIVPCHRVVAGDGGLGGFGSGLEMKRFLLRLEVSGK